MNPYLITGPALISFSGGRTSGYMLHQILEAHGGQLPDDVHVTFANTGKEREETLRFVHECGTRWGVDIHWCEWLPRPRGLEGRDTPVDQRFAEVGYNSASRAGEPFAALIERKSYTPNSVTRFCTMEMKIEVLKWFMLSRGYEKWTNVVGLRWDEMWRVFKAIARNESGGERWQTIMPMATKATKVTKLMVAEFWAAQPFDLGLKGYEGNCDLCFLKGKEKLKRLIRENPEMADWWIEQERLAGATFSSRYSYADLVREVRQSPMLPMSLEDDDEFDAECGLICGGEEAA